MSSAIERIQGFACEVDQEKWEELVRLDPSAKLISVSIGAMNLYGYAHYCRDEKVLALRGTLERAGVVTLIPYTDFLAKLKGEDKWEPKNGEEVEVSDTEYPSSWKVAEFVGRSRNMFVVWTSTGISAWNFCRPLRPTITRQEAEALLNKRIID